MRRLLVFAVLLALGCQDAAPKAAPPVVAPKAEAKAKADDEYLALVKRLSHKFHVEIPKAGLPGNAIVAKELADAFRKDVAGLTGKKIQWRVPIGGVSDDKGVAKVQLDDYVVGRDAPDKVVVFSEWSKVPHDPDSTSLAFCLRPVNKTIFWMGIPIDDRELARTLKAGDVVTLSATIDEAIQCPHGKERDGERDSRILDFGPGSPNNFILMVIRDAKASK